MPITNSGDFNLYNAEFQTSHFDTLQQNTDAFGAASNNCINLVPLPSVGNFRKETVFLNNMHINTRDPNSTAALDPTNMTQGEMISAKMHYNYHSMSTRQAWRDVEGDMGLYVSILGQQLAKQKLKRHLDSALISLRSMMGVVGADVRHDAAAAINHKEVWAGISKFGDATDRLTTLVCHSALANKLVDSSIDDNIYQVAGAAIYEGTAVTFGRRLISIDSDALIDQANAGRFFMLGLQEGACNVLETQEEDVLIEPVGGLVNLSHRVQGEGAANIEGLGMSYTGAANPDDAVLAVGGNWDQILGDRKSTPGVLISALAA